MICFRFFVVVVEINSTFYDFSRQFSVGFDVERLKSNNTGDDEFKRTSSGDYRKGYCILVLNNISGGVYTIRPSTFSPMQNSQFILEVESTHSFQLSHAIQSS
jgi:hypothetical protein